MVDNAIRMYIHSSQSIREHFAAPCGGLLKVTKESQTVNFDGASVGLKAGTRLVGLYIS